MGGVGAAGEFDRVFALPRGFEHDVTIRVANAEMRSDAMEPIGEPEVRPVVQNPHGRQRREMFCVFSHDGFIEACADLGAAVEADLGYVEEHVVGHQIDSCGSA